MAEKKKKSIWDVKDKEGAEEYSRERSSEEREKTPEEIKQEIEEGKKAENVYSEEGRSLEVEEDAIEDWEQGFAEGAESKSKLRKIKKKKKS